MSGEATSISSESATAAPATDKVAAPATEAKGEVDVRSAQAAALASAREKASKGDDSTFSLGASPDPEPDVKPADTKTRGPDGKFTTKDGEKQPAVAEGAQKQASPKEPTAAKTNPTVTKAEASAEAAKDQTPAVLAAPAGWTKEMKAEWEKFSPEHKKYLLEREGSQVAAIRQAGQTIKNYEDVLKPIVDVADRHKEFFAQAKMQPADVLDRLVAAQIQLEKDPARVLAAWAKDYGVDFLKQSVGSDPVAAIQKIASEAGLNLLDLALGVNGGEVRQPGNTSPAAAQDPRVEVLQKQLQELAGINQQIMARLSRQDQETLAASQEQQNQKIRSSEDAISKFAASRPDFQVLEPLIESLLPAYVAANPGLSTEQYLTAVYEQARYAHPDTRAALLNHQSRTKQLEAQEQSRAAQAAVAGGINVRGQPEAAEPELDLRAAQRAALAKARTHATH